MCAYEYVVPMFILFEQRHITHILIKVRAKQQLLVISRYNLLRVNSLADTIGNYLFLDIHVIDVFQSIL